MAEDNFDFKRALPIFAIVFVDLLGLTIVIPLLHLYATSFGANALMIGVVATAYPLMQFIGGPILGAISDKVGRKPVLLVSQIGTFAGFIVLGFANSLAVVLFARIVDGISGANIATAQAALTDITTEKNRAQGLGLIGAAFGLGFIIGPIIALVALRLTDNNYAVPAFIAALFSFISIMLTMFKFDETLPEDERKRKNSDKPVSPIAVGRRILTAIRNPLIGPLLVLMFAQQFVFFGFENLLGLFTLNRLGLNGQGNVLIFIFVGILVVIVQGGYIGPLSRRFGERRLIYAALLLVGLGLIMMSITPRQPLPGYSQAELTAELLEDDSAEELTVDLPPDDNTGWFGLAWILVAITPIALGGGLLRPSINSLLTKTVESHQFGAILGVSSSVVSAANALTPVTGGFAFEHFGSTTPFMAGGIILIILLMISSRIMDKAEHEKAKKSDIYTRIMNG